MKVQSTAPKMRKQEAKQGKASFSSFNPLATEEQMEYTGDSMKAREGKQGRKGERQKPS